MLPRLGDGSSGWIALPVSLIPGGERVAPGPGFGLAQATMLANKKTPRAEARGTIRLLVTRATPGQPGAADSPEQALKYQPAGESDFVRNQPSPLQSRRHEYGCEQQ